MKILVCGGASGFIGAPLTKALAERGHEVTATVYGTEPDPRIEGVRYAEADLTTRGAWTTMLQVAKPEVLYMAAGKTGGSGLNPLHFVTDNALMALNMFRSCAEFGVRRIIAMSSTTGYPDSPEPMKEEDYFTGDPHPAYFAPGHTRRFIERLAAMYPQLEAVFVRCAGAYGPGDDFDPVSSHVIAATVRKVAERQDPITVWGSGDAERDGLYIDDLVTALIACLDAPAGAYNFGSGEKMSVNRILSVLVTAARYYPKILHDATKPVMIQRRVLDCTKAHELGWSPQVSMAGGLLKTLDWYAHS